MLCALSISAYPGLDCTINNLPFPVLPGALPAFGDTLAFDGSPFKLFSGCLGSVDLELSWGIGSGDIVMAGRYAALTFKVNVLNLFGIVATTAALKL